MTDHIFKNFPNLDEVIKAALQADETFGEICADYEEICTWLAANQLKDSETCEECERALELRFELEQKIIRVLNQKGP